MTTIVAIIGCAGLIMGGLLFYWITQPYAADARPPLHLVHDKEDQ